MLAVFRAGIDCAVCIHPEQGWRHERLEQTDSPGDGMDADLRHGHERDRADRGVRNHQVSQVSRERLGGGLQVIENDPVASFGDSFGCGTGVVCDAIDGESLG